MTIAVDRSDYSSLLDAKPHTIKCGNARRPDEARATYGQSASGMMMASNRRRAVGAELTSRELEILRLLATRLSRREIGQRLYVSLNTVKTHQRAVYRKLDVDNRNAAGRRAQELGLLRPSAGLPAGWGTRLGVVLAESPG
jgi:ATP/maltotriose-dependent transcriptional regulator MalT